MISSSHGKPGKSHSLQGSTRHWAALEMGVVMSLECQARTVSGLTRLATSSRACLPSFLPISVSVLRSPSQWYVAFDLLAS
jgi:hypothetical protein